MIHIYDGNNQARIAWETCPDPVQYLYTVAKVEAPNPQFWVWDGLNGNARRRAIYPDYKNKRLPPPDGFYPALKRLKDVFACLSNVFQYDVPGYEADDVIATLVRKTNQPVLIHSTDGDFHQLVNERVQCTRPAYDGVPSVDVRIYKSTVGDPRDNIKGIPGFGEKAWTACNPELLKRLAAGETDNSQDLPPRWNKWLTDPANLQLLRDCYTIVGFFDVPVEQIMTGLRVGVDNPTRARELISGGIYGNPTV